MHRDDWTCAQAFARAKPLVRRAAAAPASPSSAPPLHAATQSQQQQNIREPEPLGAEPVGSSGSRESSGSSARRNGTRDQAAALHRAVLRDAAAFAARSLVGVHHFSGSWLGMDPSKAAWLAGQAAAGAAGLLSHADLFEERRAPCWDDSNMSGWGGGVVEQTLEGGSSGDGRSGRDGSSSLSGGSSSGSSGLPAMTAVAGVAGAGSVDTGRAGDGSEAWARENVGVQGFGESDDEYGEGHWTEATVVPANMGWVQRAVEAVHNSGSHSSAAGRGAGEHLSTTSTRTAPGTPRLLPSHALCAPLLRAAAGSTAGCRALVVHRRDDGWGSQRQAVSDSSNAHAADDSAVEGNHVQGRVYVDVAEEAVAGAQQLGCDVVLVRDDDQLLSTAVAESEEGLEVPAGMAGQLQVVSTRLSVGGATAAGNVSRPGSSGTTLSELLAAHTPRGGRCDACGLCSFPAGVLVWQLQ